MADAAQNVFDGAVVSPKALAGYTGIARTVPDPKKMPDGLDEGRLPLFKRVWDWYDKYICGKGEESVTEPPKKEGGPMAYNGGGFFSQMGTKSYERLLKYAIDKGFYVSEMPYQKLQREFPSDNPIQGYEMPTRDRHQISIMAYDTDGTPVSDWKKAGILAHELVGAEYFTRMGKSHEANESAVQKMTNELYPELAFA